MVTGQEVRAEFSSSDASTAAAVTIYDANGAARPLTATERLVITDITGSAASGAGVVKLISDNDADGAVDAGELLAVVSGAVSVTYRTEIYAKLGVTPKVKAAAAGQIDLVIAGVIIRS